MTNVHPQRTRLAFPQRLLPLAWILGLAASAVGALACQTKRGHEIDEVAGSDCVRCHSDDFDMATQPLHVQQLPLACESCHQSDAWSPAAGSDHATFFPLTDAHAEAGCGDCHGSNFEPGTMPTTCSGCHMSDYEHAGHPSHEGLPTTCGDCHQEDHFAPSIFEHPWPLAGHHAQAACNRCHGDSPPTYAGTSSQCVSCHLADYESADDPDHSTFPRDCASCHTPGGWQSDGKTPGGPDFEHPWPLVGEHSTAACNGCHQGNPPRYAGTTRVCVDCHQEDLQRATQPSHDNFSRDCSQCHQPTGFAGSASTGGDPNFVHPWPLRGVHGQTACGSCHVGAPPVYAGTPTDCVECHGDDRLRAQPPHDDFPSDCSTCHGNDSFSPAMFDHPWPLDGAHAAAECQSCHVGDPPRYEGTPRDCVGCHLSEYENNPVPGHDTFPTTCASCHSTQAWTPASSGHPEARFPTNGRHNYSCNQCHNPDLGPNGRGNADCVGCHVGAHSRARMDAEHRGFRGYPTGDAAPNFCLNCHPRGSE